MRTSIRGFGMNTPASNISRRFCLLVRSPRPRARKPATLSKLRSSGRKKHLAYLIGSEPEILDPAKFADVYEECISRLFYSRFYFQHCFVKGIAANTIDEHPLKYVWIDTTGGIHERTHSPASRAWIGPPDFGFLHKARTV